MNENSDFPLKWLEGARTPGAPGDNVQPCEMTGKKDSDAELLDAYSRAVISVTESLGPAVVSVSVGKRSRGYGEEPTGAGSGFVFTPDG